MEFGKRDNGEAEIAGKAFKGRGTWERPCLGRQGWELKKLVFIGVEVDRGSGCRMPRGSLLGKLARGLD